MKGYLITALLFALAIATFVFQNTALVKVNFLGWSSPDVSLALVIILAACTGALITFLIDTFRYLKAAKKSGDMLSQNKQLAREIEQLKNEQAGHTEIK